MRLTELQDAMKKLFQDRGLTPALDTLGGSDALGGPELAEFLEAVETLTDRLHDVELKDDPIYRPWI